jgi:2-polyprenyl-3-methyl-5-hydroxy-6-metoxy-1,4-benzoquinol methylase
VEGDARDLAGYADRDFDVVFSNSVLEHVGNREDQERAASEMRRVGNRYFVQTPSFWFPIEPHFLVPGFQYLPARVRALLHDRFELGWMPRAPDLHTARRDVESIRLVGARRLAELFPDARIVRERLFGWVKSLIAVGGKW